MVVGDCSYTSSADSVEIGAFAYYCLARYGSDIDQRDHFLRYVSPQLKNFIDLIIVGH